jgi:hypothetical protein
MPSKYYKVSDATLPETAPSPEEFQQHYDQLFDNTEKLDGNIYAEGIERIHRDQDPFYLPSLNEIIAAGELSQWEREGYDIGGGVDVLWETAKRAPKSIAASAIKAIQGKTGAETTERADFWERWANKVTDENRKFAAETQQKYQQRKILPGIEIQEAAKLAENLGFSGAAAGAGIGTGAVTAALPVPGARPLAYATGMTAAGTVAYNAASYEFVKEILDYMNDAKQIEGKGPLTQDEQEYIRERVLNLARKHGLWEAIPEAVGSGLGFNLLMKPLSSFLGKNLATRVVTKLGAVYGEELASETITEMGQKQQRYEAVHWGVLKDDSAEPVDWTSYKQWVHSLKDVAPQVFLLTTMLGTGTKVGTTTWNSLISRKETRADLVNNIVKAHNEGQFTKDEVTDNVLVDVAQKAKSLIDTGETSPELHQAWAELDKLVTAKAAAGQSVDSDINQFQGGDYFNEQNNEEIIQKIIEGHRATPGLSLAEANQKIIQTLYGEVANAGGIRETKGQIRGPGDVLEEGTEEGREDLELQEPGQPGGAPQTEEAIAQARQEAIEKEAPPWQKQAIRNKYLEGLGDAELTEVLNTPRSGIWKAIGMSKKRFEERAKNRDDKMAYMRERLKARRQIITKKKKIPKYSFKSAKGVHGPDTQAKKYGVQAAVRHIESDMKFTGFSHADAIDRALDYIPAQSMDLMDYYAQFEDGFVDINGKWLTRTEAAERTGITSYEYQDKETGEIKPTLVSEDLAIKGEPKYTFLTRGPGAGLLFDEVRRAFPGAHVSQREGKRGPFGVTLPNGGELLIESVNQITPEEWSLVGKWRELAKEGVQPTGEYKDANIKIRKGFGDKWTLHHESLHWLKDVGLVTPKEWAALKGATKRAINKGEMQANDRANPGSEEDVADWFADNLYNREKKQTSRIRKILDKIASFFDSIVQAIRPTGKGFVRQFQRGEVLGRRTMKASNLKSTKMNMLSPRWYSQMIRTLQDNPNLIPKSGSANDYRQAFAKLTQSQKGKPPKIKPEEYRWSGLEEYMHEWQIGIPSRLAEKGVKYDEEENQIYIEYRPWEHMDSAYWKEEGRYHFKDVPTPDVDMLEPMKLYDPYSEFVMESKIDPVEYWGIDAKLAEEFEKVNQGAFAPNLDRSDIMNFLENESNMELHEVLRGPVPPFAKGPDVYAYTEQDMKDVETVRDAYQFFNAAREQIPAGTLEEAEQFAELEEEAAVAYLRSPDVQNAMKRLEERGFKVEESMDAEYVDIYDPQGDEITDIQIDEFDFGMQPDAGMWVIATNDQMFPVTENFETGEIDTFDTEQAATNAMGEMRRAGLIPNDVVTWVRRQDAQARTPEEAYAQLEDEYYDEGGEFREEELKMADDTLSTFGFKPTQIMEDGDFRWFYVADNNFRDIAIKTAGKITLEKEEVFDVISAMNADPDVESFTPGDEGEIASALDVLDAEYEIMKDLFLKYKSGTELGAELPTQYEQYALPPSSPVAGGENYRELVLTAKPMPGYSTYKAPHFQGTDNIPFHIRFQDFNTEDGKKVLLIDEIQSDYHQAFRKKIPEGAGKFYIMDKVHNEPMLGADEESIEYFDTQEDAMEVGLEMTGEVEDFEEFYRIVEVGMPRVKLPFTHYTETAIRRMVRWAVEDGTYDGIAWTTGAQQAERYETEIRKRIDEIIIAKNKAGTYTINAFKEGSSVLQKEINNEKDLKEFLGSEMSKKAFHHFDVVGEPGTPNYESLLIQGDDLAVGAEGMQAYYDRIVPNTFKKLFGKARFGKPRPSKTKIQYPRQKEKRKPFALRHNPTGEEMFWFNSRAEANDYLNTHFGSPIIGIPKDDVSAVTTNQDLPRMQYIVQDATSQEVLHTAGSRIMAEDWIHYIGKVDDFEGGELIIEGLREDSPIQKMMDATQPTETVHYFPVTPEMTIEASKGFPLYSFKSAVARMEGKPGDNFKAAVETLKGFLPSHAPDLTFIEKLFKSPEWYSHPVFKKLVGHAVDRSELYHEHFSELNETPVNVSDGSESVHEATKKLAEKGLSRSQRLHGKTSKEYKDLEKMIDFGDTEWEIDRDKPIEDQMEEFADYWRDRGVSEHTIEVWRMHRDAYDTALKMLIAPMEEMLDQLKEQAFIAGKDPSKVDIKNFITLADDSGTRKKLSLKAAINYMHTWRGFYAPRLRDSGEWAVLAAKGEEQIRKHFKTRFEANKEKLRLERAGWKVKNVEEVEKFPEEIYQTLNLLSVEKILDKATDPDKLSLDTDAAIRFKEDVIRQVADLIRSRGFRSHMIRRGGQTVVRGYIEDPQMRFLRYASNLSAGLAKAETAKRMVNEMFNMDATKEQRAYAAAQKYIEEQLRQNDKIDKFIGLAKSVASLKYLGLPNLRSPFINVTAMLTTTPPSIQHYALGGKGKFRQIVRALMKAGKDYGKFMAKGKAKSLTKEEQAWLEEFRQKGYDMPQQTRDIMGSLQGDFGKYWGKIMGKSMWFFGKTEQWNRGTTMLAAYRLAKKQGQSETDARAHAKIAMEKAHGLYGKATLPAWAQGTNPLAKIGQLAYVYAKFAHNWMQMMYDLGIKQRNMKAFIYAFMSPLVLGGVSSLIMKSVIIGIASAIMSALGDDRDPEKLVFDSVREHLGEDVEKLTRYGLTGWAMNADISGSMSVDPGVPTKMWDLTGAIGGVVKDAGDAAHFLTTGQLLRAAETFLPVGVGNYLRAIRETSGVTTRRGRTVFDPRNRPIIPSIGETLGRAAGFRSARGALAGQAAWEAKKEKKKFHDKRSKIYEMYRAYAVNRNLSLYRKIIKKIKEYNKQVTSKGLARNIPLITPQSLKQQMSRLRQPSRSERR